MNSMYSTNPMTQARAAKTTPPAAKAPQARGGKRIQVRRSGVHGKGMFALVDLPAGEEVIEYIGEVITWKEALRRHPHDPTQPNHTFYFHISDTHVIDGARTGNSARWINHSCEPNCEADEIDGRVFVRTLQPIAAGEELNYDYGLVIDARYTPTLKKEFACYCGSPSCRGTMLAPKRKR